ncbi:protein transport protein SEC31 [Marchantia polymorpha subsp. ruderalis]|uniref:Sec16 Sec23-binding domain-containing protein n=2 Tax=Marchantia polymorpha TaxID=3197 RepID=A0AAF6BXV6_MARPO|nr:hypothetical protein MARPO_0156s0008 [Marchantia polymorpha]BBN16840.1 hypothetical protein Mp_7g09730 [Marchantia polymorpha subsp. ruderalis]|eukprot:PTQ28707.1 hypothetical protein MARPO_0156s0008 [Marchantia polymorpha]
MSTLKSIARSATVAFAPTASIMAVGTMAGAIDPSFSSSASLEILQLDFANTEEELPVIASCPTAERFNRISWGNNAVASEEYALGIIAGSLVDGTITLWNPAKLTSEDGGSPEESVIASWRKHEGTVRGLELSVLAPNLLASGGDDGDIYIWDLKVPTNPTHTPNLNNASPRGEISYLSWNRKVQPILASTSSSGTSVVWDLRKAKPVLSFTDPDIRRRCSTLQWNPENATQLIVASDDDRSPSLQVWDLRNSVSPLKELVGHSKGVLAMAWCPIDSSLLLTCAKDNLTLCWDTFTGEILCELPARTNWNFDVQWSPRTPGVLSTSSFDGNIGIYNIEACSQTPSNVTSFGHTIKGTNSSYAKKAPKWLKRPVGVSFGFGGKLITFGPSKKTVPGGFGTSSEIRLHSLVTEEDLVKQSTQFETAIADGDKPAMRQFCDLKAETARSDDDQQTWKFLKVMLEDDARKKLLAHLNFDVQPTENDDDRRPEQKPDGSEDTIPVDSESPEGDCEPSPSPVDEDVQQASEAGEDDFFDNIHTPKKSDGVPTGGLSDLTLDSDRIEVDSSQSPATEGGDVDHLIESEEAIQRALVVGDFALAVKHCMTANRMADALIIARLGEATLWEKTQNAYIRKTGRSYLKIMSAIVNHDLKGLVETRPLMAWKETLALLCTYAPFEDWTQLSDALAARLDAAGEIQAATLCYICSGNIEKVAEIWSRSLETVNGGKVFVDSLQTLMEKVVILSLATGQKFISASLARLVKIYAELLVSQGLLVTAMEYLSLVPADQSSLELSILQDRIYGSGKVSDAKAEAPTIPWERQPLQFEAPAATEPLQNNYPSASSNVSRDYQAFATPPSFQPQQQPAYGGMTANHAGYYPSPTLQPTQAPFVPTPVNPPSVSQVKGFVPMAPPAIPNVEQYQPTGQNQYYTGSSNAQSFTPSQFSQPSFTPAPPSGNYTQVPQPMTFTPLSQPPFSAVAQTPSFAPAQLPNMMLPGPAQPVTAPPAVQGFMPASPRTQPLSSSGIVPGSQVQSPQTTSSPSPAVALTPPPTVQTVDTSSVSAELKPVVATLTRLFHETSEASGGARANPAKRREMENNSRRLGALFAKLNTADISANASLKLIQLCQALDARDYSSALQIQVGLTTSDYDECGFWLPTLKQMIKTRQSLMR